MKICITKLSLHKLGLPVQNIIFLALLQIMYVWQVNVGCFNAII